MAGSEEELKSLLMKVNEESEKSGLKHNIQKMKIMAFSPINSLHGKWIGKHWKQRDFIFSGSKSLWMVTVAMKLKDVCSLEEKL